jgi:hypothetical protein
VVPIKHPVITRGGSNTNSMNDNVLVILPKCTWTARSQLCLVDGETYKRCPKNFIEILSKSMQGKKVARQWRIMQMF